MIILFITNYLPPIVDGVGDYTYNIAMEFARHGHKVHVICRANKEIRKNYQGITVVPVIANWNKTAGKQIAAYVRQHHVGVVSLQYVPHGFHPKGLPLGLIYCMKEIKKTGVQVMTFCHEVCIGFEKWYNPIYVITSLIMRFITKSIVGCSDIVATSIEHYKKRLSRMVSKTVVTMPIPSNVPYKKFDINDLKELRSTIASEDETIISLFGNRDFSNAIAAIKDLIKDGYNIRVMAIGKVNASIPRNEECIYFTGCRELKELSQYMAISDIMVLPENLKSGCTFKSGSLAAAIRYNIPLISMKGFMTEKVHDKIVVYVGSDRKEEYIKAIVGLISDPVKTKQMKENCCVMAKNMSWTATYNKYCSLIKL